MKDGHPHIIAECAKCGFRFDILFGIGCPKCRTEAVKQAFAPIDPLRTALGVGLVPDAELDGVWHWHGEPYKRGKRFTGPVKLAKDEADPKGCKIPLGDDAQVYELKRRFRL